MSVEKLAYTLDETAKALTLSRATVFKLVKSGRLRAVRVGSRALIPVRELERFLEVSK